MSIEHSSMARNKILPVPKLDQDMNFKPIIDLTRCNWYDYHLHWVSRGKSSPDFKLLNKWIKDAYVGRGNIVCKKPNQWCMDMVTLDVADGLKAHGLGKGVPPQNALCLERWLETLFDFLENIVWDNGCNAYPLQC
jgi:hypothetical protein